MKRKVVLLGAALLLLGSFGFWIHQISLSSRKDRKENPQEEERQSQAPETVAPADKQSVPALARDLKAKQTPARWEAAIALGRMGPAAQEAVPALAESLKDKDVRCRWQAAIALGQIGREARGAVPALAEALSDEEAHVRRQAVAALGRIGPDAAAAVPALAKVLKDKDADLRRQAAIALQRIGPGAKGAIPALIEALKDREAGVREAAVLALDKIGPDAKAAIPALAETIRDPDADVRWRAAVVLGRFGSEAKPAVPALVEMLKDDSWGMRRLAAETLGKIGPEGSAAVPALQAALKDPDVVVQQEAAQALQLIQGGEKAEAPEPSLDDLLEPDRALTILQKSQNPHELQRAAISLCRSTDPKALDSLAVFLQEPSFWKRLDPEQRQRPLRLGRVLTVFAKMASPKTQSVMLELGEHKEFIKDYRRVDILIDSCGMIAKPSPQLLAFLDSIATPKGGYTGRVLTALANMQSREACLLIEERILSEDYDAITKQSCFEKSLLRNRTDPTILELYRRLMHADIKDASVRNTLVLSLFVYRPSPTLDDAATEVLKEQLKLADVALRLEVAEDTKNSVRKAQKEIKEVLVKRQANK